MNRSVNACKGILYTVAACLVFLSQVGCGDSKEDAVKEPEHKVVAKRVYTAVVKPSQEQVNVEYVGVLEAFKKVDVACETGGTIENLYFEKGDRVTKGQLLAEVSTSSRRLEVQRAKAAMEAAKSRLLKVQRGSRPEEIKIARAVLKEAEAAGREAQLHFERIKSLFEQGVASRSELDSARRRLETAQARVDSAEKRLELAVEGPRIEEREMARAAFEEAKAALALAKDRLQKSRLLAPCDGVIAFREAEEGEVIVVPPEKIITRVVDLGRLKIAVSIGEKDIHILEKQGRFLFTVDALGEGKAFFAELSFISPSADPATRSFPVELIVQDPAPGMTDGMTVRVKLQAGGKGNTVKIPAAWLAEERGEIGVYLLGRGRAVFRKVELGKYYRQKVEIVSGLEIGEEVITNPSGLESGDRVVLK